MTEEELRALVRQCKVQRIEFKATEAVAADVARAIDALANNGGGSLLLGFGDDGEFLGLWYTQPPQINRHLRTMPDMDTWRQWVVMSRNTASRPLPLRWSTSPSPAETSSLPTCLSVPRQDLTRKQLYSHPD